jgi:predicted transcriptional regulator
MTIQPTQQPLSPAETEILQIVWKLDRAAVQQVLDELPKDRPIAYATVQTLLRRLEKKGYIVHTTEGKAHIFRAVVQKDKVLKSAVAGFLDRLFGGDALPLVQYLAENNKISLDDIEKLRNTIEDIASYKKENSK